MPSKIRQAKVLIVSGYVFALAERKNVTQKKIQYRYSAAAIASAAAG